MLIKKRKLIKQQKKKLSKIKETRNKLKTSFGFYSVKTIEPCILTKKQLETGRRSLSKKLKKHIKIFVKVKLNRNVSEKPQGIRMGKGKGSVSQKILKLKSYSSVFEIGLLNYKLANKQLLKLKKKLPVNSKVC